MLGLQQQMDRRKRSALLQLSILVEEISALNRISKLGNAVEDVSLIEKNKAIFDRQIREGYL